jgi:hypothetical protein
LLKGLAPPKTINEFESLETAGPKSDRSRCGQRDRLTGAIYANGLEAQQVFFGKIAPPFEVGHPQHPWRRALSGDARRLRPKEIRRPNLLPNPFDQAWRL